MLDSRLTILMDNQALQVIVGEHVDWGLQWLWPVFLGDSNLSQFEPQVVLSRAHNLRVLLPHVTRSQQAEHHPVHTSVRRCPLLY